MTALLRHYYLPAGIRPLPSTFHAPMEGDEILTHYLTAVPRSYYTCAAGLFQGQPTAILYMFRYIYVTTIITYHARRSYKNHIIARGPYARYYTLVTDHQSSYLTTFTRITALCTILRSVVSAYNTYRSPRRATIPVTPVHSPS